MAYSIGMIISTLSIWLVNSRALPELAQELLLIAGRPYDIFTGFWKVIFLLVLPIAFMVTFPAQTLMGNFKWWWIASAPLLALIFLKASSLFWNYALRHYQSASS